MSAALKARNPKKEDENELLGVLRRASDSRIAKFNADEMIETAYRARVHRIASDDSSDEVIQNRTPDHAGIIISELFRKAKPQGDVRIICDRLSDIAYGKDEVIEAARAFLQEGGSIQILIEEPVSYSESRFLNAFRDRIEAEEIDLRLVESSIKKKYRFHMMVVDGLHFRFQPDRGRFDAFARFRANEDAAWKVDAFERIQRHSPEQFDPAKAREHISQVEIASAI